MTGRKWTPGPWVSQGNPKFEDLEVFSGHSRIADINDVNGVTFGPPESEAVANAHLIAAAPDLYDALEWAEMMIDNIRNGRGCSQIEGDDCQAVCREALAKARGES